MKGFKIIIYILGGFFVAGSIYGAFVYLPEFIEPETQLATVNERSEPIAQTDESPTDCSTIECPTCETIECPIAECPTCEPEIITREVEKIVEVLVIQEVEVIKKVEVIKEVIKEVSADCPTCSDCSNEQALINSLQDQIASLQSQIQYLESTSEQPVAEYSDLQPTIKNVSKTISGSPPQTGGTVIKLLSLSNLGGRSFQLRKIAFTTNDNPQFYNLKACNRSDSCSGSGNPVFGNNGSYYWEGSINISSAWNMTVEIAKQNCKPELNNCDWTQLNLNINLDNWILWDNSTNKQVRLVGQDNITITSD